MQHFTLLITVLTVVTYFSFFYLPTPMEEESLSSDDDYQHPRNKSLQNEEVRGKRVSTQEQKPNQLGKPGPSSSFSTTTEYAVLGLS